MDLQRKEGLPAFPVEWARSAYGSGVVVLLHSPRDSSRGEPRYCLSLPWRTQNETVNRNGVVHVASNG